MLLLLGFLIFLLLLKLIFAVVHDPTNRGVCFVTDQDQVQVLSFGNGNRLGRCHNPQLFAICGNDADLGETNPLVDLG